MKRSPLRWSIAAVVLWVHVPCEANEEQLWHHRNMGKAFYENAATQYLAVDEFRKALEISPDSARERVNYGLALLRAGKVDDGIAELERAQHQDPGIPHTWFNLGIAYKRASRYEGAIEQLERMARLVPEEPVTHYNLGVLYKLTGSSDRATAAFEKAAELDGDLAGPWFQLATAYRQANRQEDAQEAMAAFRRIKKTQAGAAVPEDLEWSYYSEIYETILPVTSKAAETFGPPRFVARDLGADLEGLAVLDANSDARPDLIVWSSSGAELLLGGEQMTGSGLEAVSGIVDVAPADFDNDGLTDICVVSAAGPELYRNAGGRFEYTDAALPAGRYSHAVWLDYDHDYDLDLFLLGSTSALARNNGKAGFSDETARFPFKSTPAMAGVVLDVMADTQGMDLAVVSADGDAVLYRDRLRGRYEAVPLKGAAGASSIVAFDYDNDGWTDLAAGSDREILLLQNDHQGGFDVERITGSGPVAFADLHSRGMADLVSGKGLHTNLGEGRFGNGTLADPVGGGRAIAVDDFNLDGGMDLATAGSDGAGRLLLNQGERGGYLRIALNGVKNPKLAPGAEVEIKAGRRYQKQTYRGLPLLFGTGSDAEIDAVRITWPNGTIQNETRQAAGESVAYEEAQRLSGSCPMVFTWNGSEFEFITDVLGVAPLGASAGDGSYFPVDHDEAIQIPGTSLEPKDGALQVRVTEELREVCYLDEVSLMAVDHPAHTDIFPNDKFKGPPFPKFRLYGVPERIDPTAARDHRGADVLDRILARDSRYPDGFNRDYAGVAERHHIELDFGEAVLGEEAILVLSGWVDWADGSTFLGRAQEDPEGLILPYLQARDAHGRWQTVVEDMGIPAGKPKTIVVDLSGLLPEGATALRIVTNLCVYWDEIFLGADPRPPDVQLTTLHARTADLSFRGFSEVIVHPERLQPERFVYGTPRPQRHWNWNPTPGNYTRYGEVMPLISDVDDRFVIMGSGDELRMAFDADALPSLPDGWSRDYLLIVDGWAKDGDANTAFSQTVDPLPYQQMPQYPYAEPAAYPAGDLHTAYRADYNTRPALRVIRPLTEGLE